MLIKVKYWVIPIHNDFKFQKEHLLIPSMSTLACKTYYTIPSTVSYSPPHWHRHAVTPTRSSGDKWSMHLDYQIWRTNSKCSSCSHQSNLWFHSAKAVKIPSNKQSFLILYIPFFFGNSLLILLIMQIRNPSFSW